MDAPADSKAVPFHSESDDDSVELEKRSDSPHSNFLREEEGGARHGNRRTNSVALLGGNENDGPTYKDQMQEKNSSPLVTTMPDTLNGPSTLSNSSVANRRYNGKRRNLNSTEARIIGAHHAGPNLRRTHSEDSTPTTDSSMWNSYEISSTQTPSDSEAGLSPGNRVFEAAVFRDRVELETQMRREFIANVGEAQVIATESYRGENDENENIEQFEKASRQPSPRRRFLILCANILLLTLVITIIAFVVTTLTSDPDEEPAPLLSLKNWTTSEEILLFPYSDSSYTMIIGGKFGAGVSISDNGTRVLVQYGETQEMQQTTGENRRDLAVYNGHAAAELFDCSGTVCVAIATMLEAVFGVGTKTAALSGDGSRIAVEYLSYPYEDSRSLFIYSVDTSGADEPVVMEELDLPFNSSHIVSLDSTGDILAILDTRQSGDATVLVYNATEAEYQPLGLPIERNSNELSKVLSLSSRGSAMAIGSNVISTTSPDCGLESAILDKESTGCTVRVYEVGSTGIVQIGSDIRGNPDETLRSEEAISLSEDGTIAAVAVTKQGRDGSCEPIGDDSFDQKYVKVFRLSQSDGPSLLWEPMGNVISGEVGELFGESISLSGDGQTLVVGAASSESNGLGSGRVVLYDYASDTNRWVQTGADLLGRAGSSFGRSVAISKDGESIVAGMPLDKSEGKNAGAAAVFRLSKIFA